MLMFKIKGKTLSINVFTPNDEAPSIKVDVIKDADGVDCCLYNGALVIIQNPKGDKPYILTGGNNEA